MKRVIQKLSWMSLVIVTGIALLNTGCKNDGGSLSKHEGIEATHPSTSSG
jgi:hypothetical protein